MRKTALLLGLCLALLAGDARTVKLQIMAKLAHLFVPHKPVPTVYVDPSLALPVGEGVPGIEPVRECAGADILFLRRLDDALKRCDLSPKQRLVALSYKDYLRHKDRAVGAFFWQKGRPNIIINADLAEKLGIEIPDAYEKYME